MCTFDYEFYHEEKGTRKQAPSKQRRESSSSAEDRSSSQPAFTFCDEFHQSASSMNGNQKNEGGEAPPPLATPTSRPVYATSIFTPDPSVGHLLYTMRKIGPKPPIEPSEAIDLDEAEAEEDYEFLEQLLQSKELNSLVKAHNVILFCNQEQCPCVSNACQITAEVMEDIRPYALMMEECRELYGLLTAPHVRVRKCYCFGANLRLK